jgi:hypothetical protein
MRNYKKTFFVCLFVFFYFSLSAQTHISVLMDNQIYYILEQSEQRGLCAPLTGIRPYSQDIIISAIKEILNSENAEKLKPSEKETLEHYMAKFVKPKRGIDWNRGGFYGETTIGSKGDVISLDLGIGADLEGSAGIYSDSKLWGTEIWLQVYLKGDIGSNFSYWFNFEGGLAKAPRKYLGEYNIYYEGFESESGEFANDLISVYSEPLTHFPYAYKKRWDSSVFFFSKLSSYNYWPDKIAGGYNLLSEITSSFYDNKLLIRLGRLTHEWGSTPLGSSLAFNGNARPFIGLETAFTPVSWFSFSSITGLLEYTNVNGIKDSAWSFQNAFSATMMQFRFKNYIFFDFIDAVVYPKRFELGYISPITNNFFYQNNVGDFDNMAMSFNLKAQYPGLGSIWGSIFIDEINLLADFTTEDRQMFAWQAGLSFFLPFISFSSVKLSYTKINPYCYTHNRNYNPWYGDLRMETSYSNNGVGLGYYLPPNSDELLLRMETMPTKNTAVHAQYQMIRHGADFGPSAVDGSNMLSELDPIGRGDNPVLKRFFLHDGAYQWLHIIKLGGEWSLLKAPLAFYIEAGTVISYFTNIDAPANATGKAHPYSIVDTSDYPKSTSFIASIGIRLYPK